MKKLINLTCIMWVLMFVMLLVLTACGGNKKTDSAGNPVLTKLNVSNNIKFVEKSGVLGQVKESSPALKSASIIMRAESAEDMGIEEVTTEDNETVTVENVMPINSSYSLLQNLTINGEESSELNYILNVGTGELTLLDIFPENAKRVAIDGDLIYFIDSGTLYQLNITTGIYSVITNSYYYSTYTEYSLQNNLPSDSYIFIDENRDLYIYKISAFTTALARNFIGLAEKYVKASDIWQRDSSFDSQFISSSYYDKMVNSMLYQNSWIIQDETTLKFYYITFFTDRVEISEFNMNDLSVSADKTVLPTVITKTDMTWLGYKKTGQQSFFTNGSEGITINLSLLSMNNVDCSDAPAEFYNTGMGTGVTNQSYISGSLYVRDAMDIKAWDLTPTYTDASVPLLNSGAVEFLY